MPIHVKINGATMPYKSFLFSGGEVQVRLLEPERLDDVKTVEIDCNITNSNELMELLLINNALSCRADLDNRFDVTCRYFPYARQDRVCYPGEANGTEVMFNLFLNQFHSSDTITFWDLHNVRSITENTGWDLIEPNFINIPAAELMLPPELMLTAGKKTFIVAPDKGAINRAQEAADLYRCDLVLADKVRDPNDGKIIGMTVDSQHIGDNNFLIVDDICDGGRTFIELAKILRPLTNGSVELFVTHGIFSQGFSCFDGLLDTIYTANSFKPKSELPPNVVLTQPTIGE